MSEIIPPKAESKIYYSYWERVEDPLYTLNCPHCGNIIFMSTPKLIDRLKNWAKNFNFNKLKL